MKPDLEASVFSGSEIITIKILKPSRAITIHSKDIDIETVKMTCDKNEEFAQKITYNADKETATFYFKNEIKKGKAKLSLTFSGIIKDNLRGLYKSKYKARNEEKYIATTQFEATDARRAFPCFDEPAMKATFEVSLIIPKHHTAVSNTLPIEIKEHESGYKVVSFSPTPIMSTYLLAFIAGEFESIEGKTKEGVQVRVFTTNGKTHQAKFALEVAIKSLEFFEEYFDIKYPILNMDLIAIPDFESGAMENWGAITFRETAILVDEEYSSLLNKQWVALVIAHELAHQWFGNLVTMHWWTDLWLNEGFASYIEYLAIDEIFPHWKIWNQFLVSDHNVALELDGLDNSHPIEIEVHHPNEINEIFDKISYSKGASIIRMLSDYIGEENFRNGLRYYLKKHSYNNTKTADLWDSFEKTSGKPVEKMMSTWTKQKGYPLITLFSHKSDLWLTQEKFFSNRIYRKEQNSKSLWQIPISYNEKKIFFNKKKIKLDYKIHSKINNEEKSFIRVHYNDEILNNIKKEIIENHISVIDRLGVIRDIFALTEGGYIKISEALEFCLCFKNETEYIVWSEIARGVNDIDKLITNKELEEKYQKYVLSLFSPLAKNIGFNKSQKENSNETFLRSLAISQAGFYDDKKIIKEAKIIFNNRNLKPIDSDIRSAVYSIVAKNGTYKDWQILKKMYLESEIQEEKNRCIRALTQFKDREIILKTLNFIISKDVRNQDASQFLAMIWKNKWAKDLTWKFIKENWKIILKKYGEGGHSIPRILSPIGNYNAQKELEDIKKFFNKNIAPGAERTLKQAYEKAESNIAWWKDDKKDIKDWLNNNYK